MYIQLLIMDKNRMKLVKERLSYIQEVLEGRSQVQYMLINYFMYIQLHIMDKSEVSEGETVVHIIDRGRKKSGTPHVC